MSHRTDGQVFISKQGGEMKHLVLLIAIGWSSFVQAQVPVQEDRNEAEYNNQYSTVLDGYDPVSYFEEGGSVPVKGNATVSFVYGTRKYIFANEDHRQLFMANPLKYEPSYGSWCAYGMSQGAKIKINPLVFSLNGNRAHFFINKSAKRSFDEDLKASELIADDQWNKFSGESPRL
jgi:YHS domain-containing protein